MPFKACAFACTMLLAAATTASAQTPAPQHPAPLSSPPPAPQLLGPREDKPPPAEVRTPPKGQVIFFQMLTPGFLVGTGSFVKTPKGEIAGMTSIHFLDLDEGPLESIAWLGGPDLKDIASAKKALGQPGVQPTDGWEPDYHADYMLFTLEAPPKLGTPLELDSRLPTHVRARDKTSAGEKVWFPVLDGAAKPDGIRWVTGEIIAASAKTIKIKLDEALRLPGTSGTPVLSQETGKVIGLVSAGTKAPGNPTVYLAPARPIWEVMTTAESKGDRPVLKDIDWSKHGEIKPKPKKKPEPPKPSTPSPDDDE